VWRFLLAGSPKNVSWASRTWWGWFEYIAAPSHSICSTQSSCWILSGIIGAEFLILFFYCFEFWMAMKCLQLLQLISKHIYIFPLLQ
jgi:hypothetical protein